MEIPPKKYTIAVDFDGVLHSYLSPWVDAETIPDPPVPGAIEWLAEMAKKFEVVIFTTRGKSEAGRLAVIEWLLRHGLAQAMSARGLTGHFDVTAVKPPALAYIDDRAWRFDGTFPSAEQIHKARPWNKPRES